MIGKSIGDLERASRGDFSAPAAPSVYSTKAYEEALGRKSMYAPAASEIRSGALSQQALGNLSGGVAGDINASAYAVTPASQIDPTKMYANILASGSRSPYGLSSKGKYGGFYSASDLEAAIKGSAMEIKGLTPQLRSEAGKYYGQLDTAYSEAGKSPFRYFSQQGVRAQLPSIDPNRTYSSEGYIGKIVNPSRQYATKLSDWYGEAAKPAEEYLQTAQQLEVTPISQLAERIAVQQYGMNPNLASGKFTGLDTEYAKRQRDQQYIAQYGVPYDIWMAEQTKATKDQAALTKGATEYTSTQAKMDVEDATGFSSDKLKASTGMSPVQMQQALVGDYTYAGETVNGKYLVDSVKQLLSNGQTKEAADLVKDLQATPGAEAIYRLINALLGWSVGKPSAIASSTEQYLP